MHDKATCDFQRWSDLGAGGGPQTVGHARGAGGGPWGPTRPAASTATAILLDAYALTAFLAEEPAASEVGQLIAAGGTVVGHPTSRRPPIASIASTE